MALGGTACPTATNAGLPEVAQAVSPAFRDYFSASHPSAVSLRGGSAQAIRAARRPVNSARGAPQARLRVFAFLAAEGRVGEHDVVERGRVLEQAAVGLLAGLPFSPIFN